MLNYIKRYKNAQIPKPKYLSIFIFNSTKMKSLNIISVLFFSIMILSCNPTDNTTQTGHKDFSIGEIVEFYSDVDPTSERYFNESIALVGGGNAGMEIATALQNEVGFIALMSDFQFSWRSHYVGDVRSVNAQFIDGK